MKLNEEDKKLINKLLKEMRKKASAPPPVGDYNGYEKGLVYWAGINNEGRSFHSNNHACHAQLGHPKNNWPYKFIASRINWSYNARPLEQKIVDSYLRWLTMYSPLASAFVIKGGVKCRKLGYVVVRTDIPANFMAAALISVRQIVECFGQPVLLWYKLKENGLHPSLAYAHGYSVTCGDHKNVSLSSGNAHSQWSWSTTTKERIINFKNKKMVNATDDYTKGTRYSPQSSLYGDGNYNNKFTADIAKIASKAEAETIALQNVGAKVSANIFKQGLKKQVDVDIFCKLYAEALIEFYGKDNNP